MRAISYLFAGVFFWWHSGVIDAANCTDHIVELSIINGTHAEELADILACSRSARYIITVKWYGKINLSRTLSIGQGTALNITGFQGAAIAGDGAIQLFAVTGGAMLNLRDVSLEGGWAPDGGGAIFANETSYIDLHDCKFSSNEAAGSGGSLYVEEGVVVIDGETSFTDNVGGSGGGGAMYFDSSNVSISGITRLENNAGKNGGAIMVSSCPSVVFEGYMIVISNRAQFYGGAMYFVSSKVRLRGSIQLEVNSASVGGAIFVWTCESFIVEGNASFTNNTAENYGGAMHLESSNVMFEGTLWLDRNTAQIGGAIRASSCPSIVFEGNMFASNNIATSVDGGGVIAVASSSVMFDGDMTLEGNSATAGRGGAISASSCPSLVFRGATHAGNNTAGNYGGAMWFQECAVVALEGTMRLMNNMGSNGGGMSVWDCPSVVVEGDFYAKNNTAHDRGGAIFFYSSNIGIGSTMELRDNAAGWGGAIFAQDCQSLALKGNSTLANNVAGVDGGALRLEASNVRLGGSMQLKYNEAVDGGAISALACELLAFDGVMYMANNLAEDYGGAMSLSSSNVSVRGVMELVANMADHAGAVNAEDCPSIIFDGQTYISNNTALEYGGAISLSSGNMSVWGLMRLEHNHANYGGAMRTGAANVVFDGEVYVTDNVATLNGGGLFLDGEETMVTFLGLGGFENNRVDDDGGAVYVGLHSNFVAHGIHFTRNEATRGGGGGIYGGTEAMVDLVAVNFTSNTAEGGGGVALIGTRGATVQGCSFHRNHGTDGGGIYSSSGLGTIINISESTFANNFAAGSGGGLFHYGPLTSLNGTTFRDNAAVQGPAVMSVGSMGSMQGATFDGNTFYCTAELYGYDEKSTSENVEHTCRFAEVCNGCSSSCDNTPPGAIVKYQDYVPVCTEIPTGVDDSEDGVTLELLDLDEGYYRTSNLSHDVLECYQKKACQGGVVVESFCADGYEGVYCAVCAGNYAPGLSYSCRSCIGNDRTIALGLSSVFFVLAGLVIFIAVADLLRTVDEAAGEKETLQPFGSWSFVSRVAGVMPWSAIKIVVVVWQIVSQFKEVTGVKYPDLYEDFIVVLDLFNLNIGFILSFACIVHTNYHDRLLYSTVGPMLVLAVLALLYIIARKRNCHSRVAMRSVERKHLSVALFVLFLVYSSVSHTIFQAFVCETLDNDIAYVKADYSLECNTIKHKAFMVYAAAMVVVYPVGIPSTFSWWLFRHRNALTNRTHNMEGLDELEAFRDLWEPYKSHRFYYEIVEYARRIALTGLSVFIFPGSSAQVAIVLLLELSWAMLFEVLSPFSRLAATWLYRAGTCTIVLSMYLALLLKVDVSDEDHNSQNVFAGLLIAAHAGLMVAVFAQSFLWLAESRLEEIVEEKPPRFLAYNVACGSKSRLRVHDSLEM